MLATYIFKVYGSITPPIFNELFRQRDISYNLQSNPNFAATNVKWYRQYFLSRFKDLGYCTFKAGSVN